MGRSELETSQPLLVDAIKSNISEFYDFPFRGINIKYVSEKIISRCKEKLLFTSFFMIQRTEISLKKLVCPYLMTDFTTFNSFIICRSLILS